MKLQNELSRAFKETLEKDLILEIENDKYLSDAAFKTAKQRAVALLQPSIDRVTNMLTLSIIEHREVEHGEDRTVEREITSVQMSEEDVEVSVKGWWRD